MAEPGYQIIKEGFIYPTPAGAYFAVQTADKSPARSFLYSILRKPVSEPLNAESINQFWDGDEHEACATLYRLQEAGYLQLMDQAQVISQKSADEALPLYLEELCINGKALLSDENGFCVANKGFPHEAVEELSAFGVNLLSISERHAGLLRNNLGINASAWGLIDELGCSRIGFWPIILERNQFMLVVSGVPQFNCQEFTHLIHYLATRYH